jgi:hypothetical protein
VRIERSANRRPLTFYALLHVDTGHADPVLILPNDKRRPARPGQARCYHARACLEIAGFSANDVENCFAGLVEEGLLEHDDDNNLVFTGLSTSGRDTVGAIRNQEFPDETKSNAD